MNIPHIPAEKAVPLAERIVAIFHEVHELVTHPPSGAEMIEHGLTPSKLVSRYLVEARRAIDETTPFPKLGGGDHTSIGRDSIRMMVEGDIARLSAYVVSAKLALSRGQPVSEEAGGRAVMIAAVTISSLLAAPNLSPEQGREAGPAVKTDESGFRGTEK